MNAGMWETAVDTLLSMCLDYKIGRGNTKKAFVLTLKIYSDEMDKLIKPEPGQEAICVWPDHSTRKVMITSVNGDAAHIIWNERHAPIEGQGSVVGMEETVPLNWLDI